MLPSAAEETRPTPTTREGETRPSSVQSPRSRPPRLGVSRFLPGALLGLLAAAYLLAPIRTNVLIIGTDRRPGEASEAARSDTLILTTFLPLKPYVGMLSIPRDLWVDIPGFGPNRVNAAFFLAEAQRPGTGPQAAMQTIRSNFGVDVDGYVQFEFGEFVRFVDALGGVVVNLPAPMSGYPAGPVLLDGVRALAFVRDRKGSDDFFRMERGQIFLRALLHAAASPKTWPRWPFAFLALLGAVETNVPVWEWPRLGFSLLRTGPGGIDGRVIGRDMASGFTTDAGAQVLAPDWTRINPVLMEMFGQ
jgi:LCP family protein required for cell wall assembly